MISKEVLENESREESAKVPIPSVATKTVTTTTNITSSRTHNYDNNKPEKTRQGAITSTADLPRQPVNNNNNTIQKEQGLGKKEETVSTSKEPVKHEATVSLSESKTIANERSALSSKPTMTTQGKNNMPSSTPPSSSLTTKTSEPPEKILSEEAEEVAAEKAVTKVETEASSSSMTDNAKIQQQNQQKIENEVPTTTSTIQRQENIQPEVEVTIKPPNNIELNPPISAENVSTAIEEGISGSSAVDDIRGSKEQQDRQPQQSFYEGKVEQNNKHLPNRLNSFTTGFALWQHSIIYWIDMYYEFATDAAKLTEYWFNAFVNLSTEREEKNDDEKIM